MFKRALFAQLEKGYRDVRFFSHPIIDTAIFVPQQLFRRNRLYEERRQEDEGLLACVTSTVLQATLAILH